MSSAGLYESLPFLDSLLTELVLCWPNVGSYSCWLMTIIVESNLGNEGLCPSSYLSVPTYYRLPLQQYSLNLRVGGIIELVRA